MLGVPHHGLIFLFDFGTLELLQPTVPNIHLMN